MNWYLLLPCLTFTIKWIEQDWLIPCQFKVTGWSNMFIYDMILRCAGTFKNGLCLNQLQHI